MSVVEKIQVTESIWEDLCKTAKGIASPEWHGRVFNEREENANTGESEFLDWETAKKDIRNELS